MKPGRAGSKPGHSTRSVCSPPGSIRRRVGESWVLRSHRPRYWRASCSRATPRRFIAVKWRPTNTGSDTDGVGELVPRLPGRPGRRRRFALRHRARARHHVVVLSARIDVCEEEYDDASGSALGGGRVAIPFAAERLRGRASSRRRQPTSRSATWPADGVRRRILPSLGTDVRFLGGGRAPCGTRRAARATAVRRPSWLAPGRGCRRARTATTSAQ